MVKHWVFLFLPLSVCLGTRYLLSPHALSGGWISSSPGWLTATVCGSVYSLQTQPIRTPERLKQREVFTQQNMCVFVQDLVMSKASLCQVSFFYPLHSTLRARLCLGCLKQLPVAWKPSLSVAWLVYFLFQIEFSLVFRTWLFFILLVIQAIWVRSVAWLYKDLFLDSIQGQVKSRVPFPLFFHYSMVFSKELCSV